MQDSRKCWKCPNQTYLSGNFNIKKETYQKQMGNTESIPSNKNIVT